MKSILDRSFRYVPSVETDLRKTFARVRRLQKQQAARQEKTEAEVRAKVRSIDPFKKAGS